MEKAKTTKKVRRIEEISYKVSIRDNLSRKLIQKKLFQKEEPAREFYNNQNKSNTMVELSKYVDSKEAIIDKKEILV